jgi:hypothetical protein
MPNPSQIQLSSDQQANWPACHIDRKAMDDMLLEHDAYRREGASDLHEPPAGETFFAAATRLGLIGCLQGGPSDLSSNPIHMEGFGQSDG